MTKLWKKVSKTIERLPEGEQDAMAAILLEEVESEERWVAAFSESQELLAELAEEALAEYRVGKTTPLEFGKGV
jgi:hypothetical protein